MDSPPAPRPLPGPPRVLHIITRYTSGGSEQRLRDVIAAVDAEHHVVVGRESDPGRIDDLRQRALVDQLDSLVRSVSPRDDLAALRSLTATARSGHFDVVHTHQAKGGLLGRLAARAGRVPTVFHSASMASFGPGYGRWESRGFALLERATAPLVDRYFVVGFDLADRLAANGVPRDRLDIVRSSLDLRAFGPPEPEEQRRIRARLGLEVDAPTLAYVGSLDARKGVLTLGPLVEYARRITGEDVRLVVAGDGELRGELEHTTRATLGPGVVTLLGHVPYVADVMAAADALVLPSAAEGLPQVLVQAAASHLPFAAYRVDGVEEMRSLGAVGRSVPLGDHRGLALAAIGALALGRDGRRDGIEPERLRPWDAEEVARQYAEAYAAVGVSGRRVR